MSEHLNYDVVIIGAGPAGLSAAIRLKQKRSELSVCLIEKASEIGAHILSGAVIATRALDELLPDWRARDLAQMRPVSAERWWWMGDKKRWSLPVIGPLRNRNNLIVSLGELCRGLAIVAEGLGVELFCGFTADRPLFNQHNHVTGINTGEFGRDANQQQTTNYQPKIPIYAKQLLVAEGCRGSLAKQLIAHYQLNQHCCPQTYAIGLKEVWRVPQNQPGRVTHTIGWPLDNRTYGGGYIYERDDRLVSLGMIIGLDYRNPWLDPFKELQRFKTHPQIAAQLAGGERLSFGAKALVEGGYQAIPHLAFPGGLLIGDAAGFVNAAKLKGVHMAMKSGIVAADVLADTATLKEGATQSAYDHRLKQSWLGQELKRVRNLRPSFRWGLHLGLAYSACEYFIFRGRSPWTFKHRADHYALAAASNYTPIDYPKPDGKLTFDKLGSVYLSGTHHNDNQPCHLQLRDAALAISLNHRHYASPETRYCPADVYEILQDATGKPRLQINAQNCLHCKTCDIKDPSQNIDWRPPEGGGGPNYQAM